MKRIFLITTTLLSAAMIYSQESYTFRFQESDFAVNHSGDTVRVETQQSDYNQTYEVGQPQLPLTTKRILNPSGQVVTDFTVSVAKRVIASDVILPAVEEPKYVGEVSDSPSVFIAANKSLSSAVSLTDGDGRHHGFSYSTWETAPFLYDADTRELMFVDSVTVSPARSAAPSETAGSIEIKPRPDLMDWSDMENQAARATYQTVDLPNHPLGVTPGAEQIDYVIVTADSLKDAFTPLARLKRLKGLRVKVESIENILEMPCEYTRPQEKLKYYLYKLYQNNGLKWCMLGGDERIIPVQHCYIALKGVDPGYYNIPVDRYYACYEKDFCWNANGNDVYGEVKNDTNKLVKDDEIDFTNEIHLSRLPIHKKEHIEGWLSKLLIYTLNPPKDIDVSKVFLFGNKVKIASDSYDYMNEIRSALVEKNIFCDMLFNVFSNIAGEDSISACGVYNQLNKGYNFVNAYLHGDVKRYKTSEESDYTREMAASQTNTFPSVIAALACDTNEFDSSTEPCLSETFLRNPNGGAVAYFGWSRLAYIAVGKPLNRDFVYRAFDISELNGFASYVDCAVNNNWEDYYKNDFYRWTLFGLNAMGDPEMNIYPGKYMDLDINFDGNKITFPLNKSLLSSDIKYVYRSVSDTTDLAVNTYDINNPDAVCEIPAYSFDAMFYGRTYVPLIYLNRHGETYTLDNIDIAYNMVIRADKVIIGENVRIMPYARLKIVTKDDIEIKSNVECQQNGKIELRYE